MRVSWRGLLLGKSPPHPLNQTYTKDDADVAEICPDHPEQEGEHCELCNAEDRMITHLVEVTNSFNWGKFMLARFDAEEWRRRSEIDAGSLLLRGRGWTPRHVMILDLQTGEGAIFQPGGSAKADLHKHQIWCCPMFEVFLDWFYKHPEHFEDITTVPPMLELSDKEAMDASAFTGYRRPGPDEETRKKAEDETKVGIAPKRRRRSKP